jgi:hypothetical protein
VPSERAAYVFILVHMVASSLHGWSHFHTGVPTNFIQNVFIATVIVAMPPLAGTFIALRKPHLGYALLLLSMAGSLAFGVAFHFVLDTPDLCINVRGAGARMFLVSAVLLALVELVGAVWAVYRWRRVITLRKIDHVVPA